MSFEYGEEITSIVSFVQETFAFLEGEGNNFYGAILQYSVKMPWKWLENSVNL